MEEIHTRVPEREEMHFGFGGINVLKLLVLQLGLGFHGGSDGKESTCNVGRDLGLIPGLRGSPGGGHGNPLQYSCLENRHGQRSLEGYRPWSHKESDVTEGPSAAHCCRWLFCGLQKV